MNTSSTVVSVLSASVLLALVCSTSPAQEPVRNERFVSHADPVQSPSFEFSKSFELAWHREGPRRATRMGMILGGVAGAAFGAYIGVKNYREAVGIPFMGAMRVYVTTLAGGAVGLVVGGLVGRAIDGTDDGTGSGGWLPGVGHGRRLCFGLSFSLGN